MDKETMEKPEMEDIDIMRAPKRLKLIIFIVDTSGAMRGEPIAAINKCVSELLIYLKEMQREESDVLYSIGILQFNNEAKWRTESPIPIFEFLWEDLDAGQSAMYGKALDSLDRRMSRHDLFSYVGKKCEPLLLFFTEGNSDDDYEEPLARLKTNGWFHHSQKVVISMLDADEKMVRSIADDEESIFEINSIEEMYGLSDILVRSGYFDVFHLGPRGNHRDSEEDEDLCQEYSETGSDDDFFGDIDIDFDDGSFM